MRIKFEAHAENQIKERLLDKKQVEETLLNPDNIVDSKNNRKIAQKVFQAKGFKFLLRVIYVIENSDFVVLSAYKTTRIEKYVVKE
ncbi:MAG: DUF4258 domain-containing protein [Candidatus ainarchaeum sp.]|nr:DUF4258 domain-containing protein [Candidatus ainarchaeum sp.]